MAGTSHCYKQKSSLLPKGGGTHERDIEMTTKKTPASDIEYRARVHIKQAQDSLAELRQHKLNELRQVESKLDAMTALFAGRGKA